MVCWWFRVSCNRTNIPYLWFHTTLFNGRNYLSELRLKLTHVNNRGPWNKSKRRPFWSGLNVFTVPQSFLNDKTYRVHNTRGVGYFMSCLFRAITATARKLLPILAIHYHFLLSCISMHKEQLKSPPKRLRCMDMRRRASMKTFKKCLIGWCSCLYSYLFH